MPRIKGNGKSLTFHQPIMDGDASIYKVKTSGDVYQFRMWIKDERKHYRKSLKTTDYNTAFINAKQIATELSSITYEGNHVFGLKVEELVEMYLDYRLQEIDGGDEGITNETWRGIRSMLKNIITILGKDTKVSSLKVNQIFEYRSLRFAISTIGLQALKNEQAAINAMMKWGYRNNLVGLEMFAFKGLKGIVPTNETFTDKEMRKLIRFMETWTKEKNCDSKIDQLEKLLIRDYVLIMSNTGMRVGESRKLKYRNILNREDHNSEVTNEKTCIVELRVERMTSKVRKTRTFFARGGQYFDRLKERMIYTADNDLVFSLNGTKGILKYKWEVHWKELMNGIGITNHTERKLQWGSLRHLCITRRIASGVSPIEVAEMCGTSVAQISKVYLAFKKEQSRGAALKSYKNNLDGRITPTIQTDRGQVPQ